MSQFRKVIFFLIGYPIYALAQPSYPVVDKEVQRARDQERYLILEKELLLEHQELTRTTNVLATSPTQQLAAKAHRHSENIKALQRELRSADAAQKSSDVPLRVVVKAGRQAGQPSTGGGIAVATYWNPYNRATDARPANDSSTIPRRDAP